MIPNIYKCRPFLPWVWQRLDLIFQKLFYIVVCFKKNETKTISTWKLAILATRKPEWNFLLTFLTNIKTKNGRMSSSRRSSSSEYVQHRLYTINRSGSGEAFYILLTPDHNNVKTYQVKTEQWRATKDISNFGVAVVNNFLYIIGGFNVATARHIKRVVR